VFHLDFVRTARAKGMSERRVAYRHVLPNALLPIVTVVGVQMGALLGGAVVVESVFSWPGLGRLAYDSITQRDFNLLLGILFMSSALVLTVNVLVDILYAWLDPRIEVA
jgi:peptide/nickel transport system permease protein